jgi:hypothetical protein
MICIGESYVVLRAFDMFNRGSLLNEGAVLVAGVFRAEIPQSFDSKWAKRCSYCFLSNLSRNMRPFPAG